MMEPTDGSPPNSMYMVSCGEMFPKPVMEKEDDKLQVPFKELPGEGVKYIAETTDGVLALTNYRIFVLRRQQEKSVPLGLIDTVQSRDLFHLIVNCKDANTVKCSFDTTEKCSEWQRRITSAVSSLINLNSLFAFPFYAWSSEQSELLQHQQRALSSASRSSSPMTAAVNHHNNGNHNSNGTLATIATEAEWSGRLRKISSQDYDEEFRKEVERLQFNLRGAWRISKVNEDFKLCPSYPRHFLVPTYITDDTLQNVASFRSSRRIPVAVWRHRTTGAIIARCSQPEVGWLGWRNNKDEELLQAFVNACAFDQGEQQQLNNNQLMVIGDGNGLAEWGKEYGRVASNGGGEFGDVLATNRLSAASDVDSVSSSMSPEGSHEEVRMDKPKKLLIVDARSYASAVTNRARGGGCESIDYYPSAEIQFMNLANIHTVRKSFNALRQLCASAPDMGSWLSNLEKTMWLQHLSGLLAASVTVTRMIEVEGRPVLVHCSDGWDRTPQIVATAQLCLDPYYRTVNGFKTLVEREWLSFGHKYGDRCGHGPHSYELNERCPVFLQWLDCVHQIHNQFPCSFEFSIGYLIKLAQHSHSGLFGTFLTNTMRERIENSIFDRTYSVWPFLSGPMYKNPLYVPNRATVLWPAFNIRDLTLWNEVYLGNLHTNQAAATSINADALGTKMETMLERMESVDGEDKMDLVMGALNLDVGVDDEDEEDEGGQGGQMATPKHTNGEPVSPMSKTRSYNDLLDANGAGNTNGPHRRCSDPTMPLELIKQNGMVVGHEERQDVALVKREVIRCDMGIGSESEEEQERPMLTLTNGNCNEEDGQRRVPDYTSLSPSLTLSNQTIGATMSNGSVDAQRVLPLLNAMPTGVLEVGVPLEPERNGIEGADSVDGSPSPPPVTHGSSHLADVMLESVDLRSSVLMSESLNFAGLSPEKVAGGGGLWHGNVETSTDTLVPTNALTEEENKHFPGIENGDLANFLTKHEVVHVQGSSVEGKMRNGIDCSVYGENSFNMALLNNQSLYDPSTAAKNENNLNIMDMSLMESVIQSQPLPSTSAKRSRVMDTHCHRRTPSNSKSEPSPHKFQNGNMSPSATMNSRFSTPGGRSPNLTPPEGPLVFEKANNVILSCPDGLAHALSEQNIRLQQIIYDHKLREEALQRELNATRLALLKRICYQCNNNQEPSSNHEEQDLSVMMMRVVVGELEGESGGGGGGSGCDDSEGEVDMELGEEEEEEESESVPDDAVGRFSAESEDLEDDLPNMLRSFCFHDAPPDPNPIPMNCSNRPATNPSMDAGENISVCSWEAVEDRASAASPASVQEDTVPASSNSKVLWVPDHAVNKCTGCSFEFWIGRRKHHCRSCGKIFCSDCSEFFAALPEERLYNPVRLCGPCYLTVTQSQHEQQQYQNQESPEHARHQMMMSNSYSSMVNHNYSHPKRLPPPPPPQPPSFTAPALSSSTPPPLPLPVVVSKFPPSLPQTATMAKSLNGDYLATTTTTTMSQQGPLSSATILRNNSSCCLEAGGGEVRRLGDRALDGPMSVSDMGPSRTSNGGTNSLDGCCTLKTATASN